MFQQTEALPHSHHRLSTQGTAGRAATASTQVTATKLYVGHELGLKAKTHVRSLLATSRASHKAQT